MHETVSIRRRRILWSNVLTVISMAILIGSEVFGIALLGGWALARMLELGKAGEWIVEAILCAGGIYLMWVFVRTAVEVEPFTDAN
jgi:hypothetical protein